MWSDKEIKAKIAEIHAKAEDDTGAGHAVYGGSTAKRWVECPGSISLVKKFPKRPAGEAAIEGSLAHLCLEGFLVSEENILETRKVLKRHFPVDMVEHAMHAFEHLVRITPTGAERLAEQKVDSSFFTIPDQWGTVDCAIVEEFGTLRVWDYKYGRGVVVDAKDNLQLIYYALALSKRYDHNFAEVELGIIQPRVGDDPIRSHTISIDDLLKHEKLFKSAVKSAESKAPKFGAGDHCRWCEGKPACPELSNAAAKEAGLDFDEIIEAPAVAVAGPPMPVSPARLQSMLDAFPKVEEYIAAVRSYAEDVLARGGKIPGYGLVDKRASRQWESEKVATEARKTWGDTAFSKPELLSPAQLEAALSKDYVASSVKRWIEKRTVSVSSGKKLAPLTGAQKDFSSIEDTTKRKGNR